MRKLNVPIEVNARIQEEFEQTKKLLLFSTTRNWFVIIEDYKIEDKVLVKKKWKLWGSSETETSHQHFLTEATVLVWNLDKKAWAVLNDSGLKLLLYDETPKKLRENYLNVIKAPLEALGVNFKQNVINE